MKIEVGVPAQPVLPRVKDIKPGEVVWVTSHGWLLKLITSGAFVNIASGRYISEEDIDEEQTALRYPDAKMIPGANQTNLA